MVEGVGATASFPVIFFDGERETDVGDVRIYPGLEYKPFQLFLSQMIGVSPNQISTYLVNRHKSPFSGRMPITGKVNFGLLCRQKGCCFLVVLKRSRKSRNRRVSAGGEFLPENRFYRTPENLVMLRRGQSGLDGRLRGLFDPTIFGSGEDLGPFGRSGFGYYMDLLLKGNEREEQLAFCEECWNAKWKGCTASFHPCVNDPVITRFTTRLGPIDRPNSVVV